MRENEETDELVREVIRRLQNLESSAPHGSQPDSPAERAIRALRREHRLTREELNRPACPW